MQSKLMGPDRRGGRNYREVFCSVCGCSVFVSKEAEGGICGRCVVMGYSGPKVDINIQDLRKAFEKKSLKEFRRKNRLSQTEIARALEISERHYRRLEVGQPISRSINRKIEKKLAQVEQVSDFEKPNFFIL